MPTELEVKSIVEPTPMLMHSVFDWRTGYHVITKPAGHFNRHPEGEGDPRRFVIVEHVGELPPQKVEVEYPSEDGTSLLTETRPCAKLNFDTFLKEAPLCESRKLDNVFALPTSQDAAVLFATGSKEDFEFQTKSFDTLKNATLTVGTSKSYASISAAITASSSGDCIEAYATALGYGAAVDSYTTGTSVRKLMVDTLNTYVIRGLGETVTASAAFTCNRIGVKLSLVGTPGGTVTVTVRTGTTGGAGTVMFAATINASDVSGTAAEVMFCDGDTPYSIGLGDTYHCEITCAGGVYDASNYVAVYYTASDAYAGGTRITYSAEEGWTATANNDVYFAMYAYSANTYTEAVADGGKTLQLRGMIANQGATISYSAAVVTLTAAGFGGSLRNFTIDAVGALGVTTGTYGLVQNCRVRQLGAVGTTRGISCNSTTITYTQVINCVVDGFAYGIYSSSTLRYVRLLFCTVVKCATIGIGSQTGQYASPIGCISAGNTADYDNCSAAASAFNTSADATANGVAAVTGFDTNDFTDYAGGDYSLKASVRATTKALFYGYPLQDSDFKLQKRRVTGTFFAGAHEPYLPAPTTLTAVDAGSGGAVNFTWDVGTATETIRIYGATGGAYSYLGSFKADLGAGIIAGLVNGTAYTFKAVYTSDGVIEGEYTDATGSVTPSAGTIPTFSGITSLSDNGDGTLTATWGAATSEDHFEVHVKASAFAGSDLADKTYLVAAADADTTGIRIGSIAAGTKLVAATTYYVCVRAANAAGTDGNSTVLSCAVTNPLAVSGPHDVLAPQTSVALAATETTIYECPATKRAVLRWKVTNTDSSARTATVYFVRSGASAAASNTVKKTVPLTIAGNDGDDYTEPYPLILGPGDKLTGLASSAAVVAAFASVIERTIE